LEIKKRLDRWFTGRKPKAGASDPVPPPAAVPVPAAAVVEPEIVAVIAAVIAIEMKMFMALQGRSFTFNESSPSQGWSELGRLLVRPFQGVR
jgi:hypothetical protein